MICKSSEYENGYIFTPTSTDKEFQKLLKSYNGNLHCIICNSRTVKNFKLPFLCQPSITINNKLADGVFFVNRIK